MLFTAPSAMYSFSFKVIPKASARDAQGVLCCGAAGAPRRKMPAPRGADTRMLFGGQSLKFVGFAAGGADFFRRGSAELVGFHLESGGNFTLRQHLHESAEANQAALVNHVQRDVV